MSEYDIVKEWLQIAYIEDSNAKKALKQALEIYNFVSEKIKRIFSAN